MAESGAGAGGVCTPAVTFRVDDIWLGTALGPTRLKLPPGLSEPGAAAGLTVMPGVVDHHVHLGLVDRRLLADGPVVEVHDLGWDLEQVAAWRAAPPHGLRIRIAGPFHTAPGGYPSGRAWAPAAAVRQVGDAAQARAAVAQAAEAGVDAIKIALNTQMPLLGDELLQALVDAAHAAKLPAIVHAEGIGQAARAIDAGADVLVHAPWSERLSDALLARAAHTTWISTLAIHAPAERAIAIDNLRRFHDTGGVVRYGTDMGNGPLPVGVNADEIHALEQAGLTGDELITALTGPVAATPDLSRALTCELPLPTNAEELVNWLACSRRLQAGELGARR